MFKNQNTAIAKAKKPITDYRRATGQAEGLAELMVFYCERAAGFSTEVGLQDEGYFDALVRMFVSNGVCQFRKLTRNPRRSPQSRTIAFPRNKSVKAPR